MIRIKTTVETAAGVEEYEQTDPGRFVLPVLVSVLRSIFDRHAPEMQAIANVVKTLGAMISSANLPDALLAPPAGISDETAPADSAPPAGDLKSMWTCPDCGTSITATSSPTGSTAATVVAYIRDRHGPVCPSQPDATVPELDSSQEPPAGSVVAIDWQRPAQEIWVSGGVGRWANADGIVDGRAPWSYLRDRAYNEQASLTLLVAADSDTFTAGWRMGARSTADLVIGRQLDQIISAGPPS